MKAPNTLHIEFLFAAGLSLVTSVVWAGRSCDTPQPPKPAVVIKGMTLAEQTLRALQSEHKKNGTKVVILARAGQDLSKYHLRYSHLGLAYLAPDGRWLVAHKLNTCGTAEAELYRHGLGEFFLDDLFRYEAAWVVPQAVLQERLHAALLSDPALNRIHIKAYNMVSYVWGSKYQQSNQWAIETLAVALNPNTSTRKQAQAWLQENGYVPSTLTIKPLERLGVNLTRANITFDDHPANKRFSDRIESVTVDSVFEWLQRSQLGGTVESIKL